MVAADFSGRVTTKALKGPSQLVGFGVSVRLAVKKKSPVTPPIGWRLRAMENYECPERKVTADRKGNLRVTVRLMGARALVIIIKSINLVP
jgi:hypothetical protein